LLFVVGGNDMKKKHLIKRGIVLALVVLLVYFSKPDRGGIQRCETLSGVPQLGAFVTHREHLWKWKPFEDPRFRFQMPLANFDALKMKTKELGFEEWVEGDGGFGSFNEFSWDNNKLYYTKKYKDSKSCFFYYRPKTERLDVIIFYH